MPPADALGVVPNPPPPTKAKQASLHAKRAMDIVVSDLWVGIAT